MVEDTWERLGARFARSPILVGGPVPEGELDAASGRLGRPLPPDYREFVLRYGAAMLGGYPILGLRKAEVMGETSWSVLDVNERFHGQDWPHAGEWLIVSIDMGGNPVGIGEDGRVMVWDHDFRQTFELGSSFEDFLRRKCLKLDNA